MVKIGPIRAFSKFRGSRCLGPEATKTNRVLEDRCPEPKFDPNISKILRVPELDLILTSGVLVEGVRNRITAYNYIIFQSKY